MNNQRKTNFQCKLHPEYKGIRPPTSKKPGCTCWSVYHEANHLNPDTRVEYQPFTYYLNTWNGNEVAEQQRKELNKQIDLLLSLFAGLAQTSQGQPENWKHRCEMMNEFNQLGVSIKTALGIL